MNTAHMDKFKIYRFSVLIIGLFIIQLSAFSKKNNDSGIITEVPLLVTQNVQLAVSAYINDSEKPVLLLLETYGKNSLRSDRKDLLMSMGINQENPIQRIKKIRIGDHVFKNESFTIHRAVQNRGTYQMPPTVLGTIGPAMMNPYVWQIDFKEMKLRITDDIKNFHIPDSVPRTKFRSSFINPACNLMIYTSAFGDMELGLDTSSPLGFVINMGKLTISQKSFYLMGFDKKVYSLDGENNTLFYTRNVDAINIEKDMLIKNQTLWFSLSEASTIGNMFLQNFIVTIDFRKNVLYLNPISQETRKYIE